ncbi:MAG: DUF308 domain-containing protein [Micromonosporaceae bacterium]|jgi:hypothetical protein|nr:DUF308 domain-containing protein [Micromonosporaceae bacterium]
MRIPSITHRSTAAEDSRPVSPGGPAPVRDRRGDRGTRSDRRPASAEGTEADRVTADQERAGHLVTGPRPRSSGLATLGLIIGVLAAVAVATGVLAALGVALGVLAVLFGVGGISATGRRHVAGRSEALFAVVLGLASVVFGILALTDALSWLSSDTDQVARLRDWLNDQMPWLDDL